VSGQNTIQLTHFHGPVTGSPHWSPDGKWLTFDSRIT
jgi:Tol biopolymer transport system component